MATKIYLIMDESTSMDEYVKTCSSACRLLTDERNIFFERIIFSSFDQIPYEEPNMNYLFIIPNNMEVVPPIIFAPMIRNRFKHALISFIIPYNDKAYIEKLTRFDVDTVFIKPTSITMTKRSINIIIDSFLEENHTVTEMIPLQVKNPKEIIMDTSITEETLSTRNLKKDVNALMMKMYCARQFKGYNYTLNAIIETINLMSDKKNVCVTKNIYPTVATRCKSTPQSVEHCIRNYIDKIFIEPNEFVVHNFMIPFGFTKRPSNAKFISIIADGFIEGWIYKLISNNIYDNAI